MSQVKVTHDAVEIGHTPDSRVSVLQALVEVGHTLGALTVLQMVVEVGYVEGEEERVLGPAVQCCG